MEINLIVVENSPISLKETHAAMTTKAPPMTINTDSGLKRVSGGPLSQMVVIISPNPYRMLMTVAASKMERSCTM